MVVDKDTGEVSMRVYAVKDQEEIPISLTALLPLLPHVEEGFYVAQGGTRYGAEDEADHEDAFKCYDIGVRTSTLTKDPGERIM
eukprot:gene10515-12442_t